MGRQSSSHGANSGCQIWHTTRTQSARLRKNAVSARSLTEWIVRSCQRPLRKKYTLMSRVAHLCSSLLTP